MTPQASTVAMSGVVAAAPGDLYARGLLGHPGGLTLRQDDGTSSPVPLAAWLGPLTADDERVLQRVSGPVLDVGCGPGRHVAALAGRGIVALGVDISAAAVRTARSRGARAIEGCVFDRVPAAGHWRTVLLLDGNIGIGGCPVSLLRRAAALASRDGRIMVELEPPGTATERFRARLEQGEDASSWFPWAQVSADAIEPFAGGAGLRVTDSFVEGSRWFATLVAA